MVDTVISMLCERTDKCENEARWLVYATTELTTPEWDYSYVLSRHAIPIVKVCDSCLPLFLDDDREWLWVVKVCPPY